MCVQSFKFLSASFFCEDGKVHLRGQQNTLADKEGSSMDSFFEENIELLKVKIPKRLLVTLLVVMLAKVAGAVFIYYSMDIQASGTFWSDPNRVYSWEQNAVLLTNSGSTGKWPLAFLGWDSAWYSSIMIKGYGFSPQSYTFSPALPFFGALTSLVLQNPMASLVLVASFFGVTWVPLYQQLAEEYMGRKAALLSVLLLSFSPYLFVFTTVAYGESLFLFFVLSAWLLCRKGRFLSASGFAAVAPLSRTMGILVIFPMLYSSLKEKTHRVRNVLLSLIPVASLTAWFAAFGFSAGDFLAPIHTSEWTNMYSFRTLLTDGFPRFGVNSLNEIFYQLSPIPLHWLLPVAVVVSMLLPLLLFYSTWKKDRSLWIYAVAGYVGILYFGALASVPRFVSVLFPLWIALTASIPVTKKSFVIAASVLCLFYVIALDLWTSFLNGQFIS
jgi:hypothetical protein